MDKRFDSRTPPPSVDDGAPREVTLTAWRALLDGAADAIFVADAETGTIVDCNRTAERLTGRSRKELIGAHQSSLHPPAEAERYRADFAQYARLGHGVSWESVLIDGAGQPIPVEISSGISEVAGQRLVLGIFRDARERQRLRAELHESAQQMGNALSGAPIPIMIHAEDGEVVLLSREWTRLTGYAREDIPTVEDWLRSAYGPEMGPARQRVEELRARQGPDFQGEFRVRTRDGTGERVWKLYAGPLGRLPDQRQLFLSMAVDLTEYRRAEARIRSDGVQLQRALSGAVEAMARAMAKRDPYTAGHQDRVAELSAALATELGLAPEHVRGIRMGAGIHDIGKIYVPAEILNRPGRLSEPEMALIRTHSEVGYDIVREIAFPWPVADMILQHHERQDGSGYPQGLRGDQICLEARILAVADVVEAISSYRPYRPALGTRAALEEVERNRGQLYDPDVARACLSLFRDKGYQLPE